MIPTLLELDDAPMMPAAAAQQAPSVAPSVATDVPNPSPKQLTVRYYYCVIKWIPLPRFIWL
jgi:hypothetical protein